MRLLNRKEFSFYPRYFGWKAPNGKLHTGIDLKTKQNENVYSPVCGRIIFSSNDVSGYGIHGDKKLGGCIWIKYLDDKAEYRYLQLGHVMTMLEAGKNVLIGEYLGFVNDYISQGSLCPHIHVAIFKGMNIPSTDWGYTEKLNCWESPLELLTTCIYFNNMGEE